MKTLLLSLLLLLPTVSFGGGPERLHHFEPELILAEPPPSPTFPVPDLWTLLLVAALAVAPAFFTLGLHVGRQSQRMGRVRLG